MAATAVSPAPRRVAALKKRRKKPDLAYWVYAPMLYWKTSTPEERLQFILQLVHRLALGFLLNEVGYYFFVFAYYVTTQLPMEKTFYNNPHWMFMSAHHIVVVHGVHTTVWVAKPFWLWARHNIIRGYGQYVLRTGFALLVLTNALTPRRQNDEHTRAAVLMGKTRIIPTETTKGHSNPLQICFSIPIAYLAGIPGALIIFGIEAGLWGLSHLTSYLHGTFWVNLHNAIQSTAGWYAGSAAKFAGILGGFVVARFIYMAIAVDWQDVLIHWFKYDSAGAPRKHQRQPHFPLTASFKAYYNSGKSEPAKHSGWVTPILIAAAVFIPLTVYVGLFIITHANTWLADPSHTLFSVAGLHLLLAPSWMHMLITSQGIHFLV